MLLPFVAWVITGVFFFIKPGYSEAYEQLNIRTYPSVHSVNLPQDNKWSEVRIFRSILGDHLLVKNKNAWEHINLKNFEPKKQPTEKQIKLLVNDAIKENLLRYGDILSINELSVITTSNIHITLDWQNMSLYQKGDDTDFINAMYKIHYLQWTGIKIIDKYLGLIGLCLVLTLSFLGVTLLLKRKK